MIAKLLGYAPDADPSIIGVLTDCANMVPTIKGMKGAPQPVSANTTVFNATCQGAAVLAKLDNTSRFFLGNNSAIAELTAINTLTDRTRASGAYALSETNRWRFAQQGDVSLATSKACTIQASASSAFADVSGAPQADIIETVGQFVFAFNTTDSVYGDSSDRWWCSALGNYASWTPSVSSQAATGRLIGSPGPITAGKRFGDSIIAFKQKSMYRGDYVGAPSSWSFVQVPGNAGALCQEVVVDIGTPYSPRLIFMGDEDFYSFDGSRPIPIGDNRIKVKVFSELLKSKQAQSLSLHDRTNSLVYFFYPSSDSPNPDKCVVYNYRTNQWGRADRQIEAAVEYVLPGLTYGDLGTHYAQYGDLPNQTYGGAFWSASFPTPTIIDTSHNIRTLNGNAANSSLTTWDMGDDQYFTTLQRVKCRYITSPTSASMTNYYRNNAGGSLTTDATTAESGGKFDVLRDARWHRVRIDFVGDVELSGLSPEFSGSGLE